MLAQTCDSYVRILRNSHAEYISSMKKESAWQRVQAAMEQSTPYSFTQNLSNLLQNKRNKQIFAVNRN